MSDNNAPNARSKPNGMDMTGMSETRKKTL
jgi:hypothetical protein